jgi:endoglucanase
MNRSPRCFFLLLVMAVFLVGARSLRAQTTDDPMQDLGRGVNVLGYDPIWQDPAKARFHPELFARIRAGGFNFVRMNLFAFSHMSPDGRLDPGWLATLDHMVAAAQGAGLKVILDEHDSESCGKDVQHCRSQLLAFWKQVAPRFQAATRSVLFEILNEPNGKLTSESWNGLLAEALQVIRQTNPTRTVVLGPGDYNSFRSLGQLVLPASDRNILVTVHYYEPFKFTHQGTTWTVPSREHDVGYHWGTTEEQEAVARDFDIMAAWGAARGRPLMLGEFGAYEAGDLASREAWTSAVTRTAEAHRMSWCYWQFEGNFAVFDISKDAWIAPIHNALIRQ